MIRRAEQLASPTTLSDSEKKLLELGEVAEAFVGSMGWKLALDWMEKREDVALNDLRKCSSSDDKILRRLHTRWQERREALNEFQEYVLGLIESKKHYNEEEKPNA